MRRGSWLGIVALLVASNAWAVDKAAEKAAADKAAEAKSISELKAIGDKMMNSWAKGDWEGFHSTVSDSMWSAWDLDMAGRPVSMKTVADLKKLFDEMTGPVKAGAISVAMSMHGSDCHLSGDLGVCLMDGDMTVTVPKMPPMTMAWRNTEVYAREKAGWKIVHHHGSVAKAPEMPPKFMSMTTKTASYQPMPGVPGASAATIWFNPVTQGMAGILKVGKEGMKQARHFHPYAQTMVVLEGSFTTTDASGKDATFKAGTIAYRAPKELHTTTIAPNSTLFVVTDGPLISVEVDEKGAPKPPAK